MGNGHKNNSDEPIFIFLRLTVVGIIINVFLLSSKKTQKTKTKNDEKNGTKYDENHIKKRQKIRICKKDAKNHIKQGYKKWIQNIISKRRSKNRLKKEKNKQYLILEYPLNLGNQNWRYQLIFSFFFY